MTLVVAIKCTGGLVLAADSRGTGYRFDPEAPESDRTVFDDKSRKLFSFRVPFDNIGVLSYDHHGVSAGFGRDEQKVAAQIQRHSIDRCIRLFKQEIYKTHPKKRITVNEFWVRFYRFLVKYWQHYREQRCDIVYKMNQYIQESASKHAETVPPITLEVKLLVTGFNQGEKAGHVLPILLTDDEKDWEGEQYRGTIAPVEMIPHPCGVFCGGVKDFVIPVLTADDPVESIRKLQRSSTETIVAEIVAMKARFDIRCVLVPPQSGFSFFASDDMPAHDAQRLALLLIRGTRDFFGGKGTVGGAIRICTLNPLSGTKCRNRS